MDYVHSMDGIIDKGSDFNNWIANAGTALSLLAEWSFYFGQQNHTYNNDKVANSFRNSRVVEEARNYWYDKANNGYPITIEVTNFRGVRRIDGGNFGISGFFKAGIDPIEQYVGSTKNITILSDGTNLTYILTNVTHFKSLAYGITPE